MSECGFTFTTERHCRRPSGHEATDGRIARHDSTPRPEPQPEPMPSEQEDK